MRLRSAIAATAFVVLGVQVANVQAEVVIETVTVGNPDNAGEQSRLELYGDDMYYGGVDYAYDIGKYEVTAGQYTEFLDAVAHTDAYGLYNTRMMSSVCRIERTGLPGNYTYSVAADWANRPVNWVSWGDAARFANWLHNGKPTGTLTGDPAQDAGLTEDGSYFLNGATNDAELMAVVREVDATWALPTEDEWYKAAYHRNDAVSGNYFDYPTSSDSVPGNDLGQPDLGNNANFYNFDEPDGWAIGSPYFLTEVGDFENSASPYGTFDQGGNLWELNETRVHSSARGMRGAAYNYGEGSMHAATRSFSVPTFETSFIGFRVADVSEPGPADLDGDGDVDLDDFALFQAAFTGSH